jgi:hypothetical protein
MAGMADGGEPNTADAAPATDHGSDGQHDHEHNWEHCSLGALASLAAITPEWPRVYVLPAAARIEVVEQGSPASLTFLPARARGPPTHA